MKKLILITAFVFTFGTAAAQWTLCSGTAGDNVIKIVKVNNDLFAGIHNSIFHGKILRSADGGAAWDSVNTGIQFSGVFDAAASGNTVCFGTYEHGLVWSTDAGATWQQDFINGVSFNGVFSTGMSGGNIITYHNTAPPGINTVFYYSSNSGSSWNPLFLGASAFIPIVFDNFGSLFVSGHTYGTALSANNGLNWSIPSNNGLPEYPDGRKEIYSIFMHNGNMYAGCIGGFAVSADSGKNWTAINMNFPNSCNFTDFEMHNNYVFGSVSQSSGTAYAGVYKSSNLGTNWTLYNSGLPASPSVKSLVISGMYLIAGSSTEGIYRIPLSVITSGGETGSYAVKEFSLSQNYPNPFNPVTKIFYTVPEESSVRISVYDITGREIAVLVNNRMKAGYYGTEFSGADIPAGIYFCKLSAEGFSETRKMILIK